jgi:hypothetical protein
MYVNHTSHITQWLTMIEGAQSCTLHWHSWSRLGGEYFTSLSPIQAANTPFLTICNLTPPQSVQDSRPTIVDAPLTLLFTMGQGGYCNPFCIQRRAIIFL